MVLKRDIVLDLAAGCRVCPIRIPWVGKLSQAAAWESKDIVIYQNSDMIQSKSIKNPKSRRHPARENQPDKWTRNYNKKVMK